jgi:hypothetical protein
MIHWRTRAASLVAPLACAAVLATCLKSASPTSAGTMLALGTWGGDNAAIIATDSVTHVHVGCTFGDFPAHVALDANGRFAVNGSYMIHAYPVAFGPTMLAQFSGQVSGSTVVFAVAVNDTVAKQVVSLGPGTVTLGKTPNMGPCPVCLVPNRFRLSFPKLARGPNVDPPRQTHR